MTGSTTPQQLELDLQAARSLGRWLSDEERSELEQRERDRLSIEEKRLSRRRRLIVLAGVCVLIPPLWPLAFGLTLFLLFPRTTARAGTAAVIMLAVLGVATAGLVAAIIFWLLVLLR